MEIKENPVSTQCFWFSNLHVIYIINNTDKMTYSLRKIVHL